MLTAIWEGLLAAKVKRGSVIPLLRYLEAEHGGDVEQLSPTELLEGAREWCEERGLTAPDKVTVGAAMRSLGVEAGRGRQGRWYRVGGCAGLTDHPAVQWMLPGVEGKQGWKADPVRGHAEFHLGERRLVVTAEQQEAA